MATQNPRVEKCTPGFCTVFFSSWFICSYAQQTKWKKDHLKSMMWLFYVSEISVCCGQLCCFSIPPVFYLKLPLSLLQKVKRRSALFRNLKKITYIAEEITEILLRFSKSRQIRIIQRYWVWSPFYCLQAWQK